MPGDRQLPMSSRLAQIRRLVDAEAEWQEDNRHVPLYVVGTTEQEPSYLFLTKLSAFQQHVDSTRVPEGWGLVSRYGIPCDEVVTACRRLVDGARELRFFGDLDPLDLTAYFELRERVNSTLQHVGINDAWLATMERHWKGARPLLEGLTIRMSHFETEHWRLLKSSTPTVVDVIGAHAATLLDDGKKLEIEAALNSNFFDVGYGPKAVELVFG
jgi:hypothetical protein